MATKEGKAGRRQGAVEQDEERRQGHAMEQAAPSNGSALADAKEREVQVLEAVARQRMEKQQNDGDSKDQAFVKRVAGRLTSSGKAMAVDSSNNTREMAKLMEARQRLDNFGSEQPPEEFDLSLPGRFALNMTGETTLARQATRNPEQSAPGAYSSGPVGDCRRVTVESTSDDESYVDDENSVPDEENRGSVRFSITVPGDHDNSGLAVANPVDESGNLPRRLSRAETFDLDASRRREHKTRLWKRNVTIAVALVLALIVVVVTGLVLSIDKADQSNSDPSSLAPSIAPTSIQERLMSLLPEETIAWLRTPDSAQAQAFEWLVNDTYHNPFLFDVHIRQRFALATLYYATNGDKWLMNENWLNHSIDECQWYNKPVFAMKDKFSDTPFLSDFFPPSDPQPDRCDDNSFYQHLWLDDNNLVGSIPNELYMISSLKTLSLGNSQLQATITSRISQLSSLEGLALVTQHSTGGTIPTEIGLLSHLRGIQLYNNNRGTIPTELWQLSNLTTVYLGRSPTLHGTIPSEIGVSFQKLRWLDIMECDLTGQIPTEIGLINTLEWLFLSRTYLTGKLPTELALATNLNVISVIGNSLTGPIPRELGALTLTTLLSLGENLFTGTIPSEIGLLTGLTLALNVRQTPTLQGTIPTELGRFSLVQEMSMEDCSFTGTIPSEFGLLTTMWWLNLKGNDLTGTIPDSFSALQSSLYTLKFNNNQRLSGEAPEALCSLNGTCDWEDPFISCSEAGFYFDCTDLLCGCDCPCSP